MDKKYKLFDNDLREVDDLNDTIYIVIYPDTNEAGEYVGALQFRDDFGEDYAEEVGIFKDSVGLLAWNYCIIDSNYEKVERAKIEKQLTLMNEYHIGE